MKAAPGVLFVVRWMCCAASTKPEKRGEIMDRKTNRVRRARRRGVVYAVCVPGTGNYAESSISPMIIA